MRRRPSLFAFVLLCVTILLLAGSSFAQVNTATLSGIVTDPQGLAVSNAKVTVTSLLNGAERVSSADENGRYVIVGLVPGAYKLHVEGGTNFAPFENPSVEVRVGTETILNVTLALGTQQQSVTVTTELSLLKPLAVKARRPSNKSRSIISPSTAATMSISP